MKNTVQYSPNEKIKENLSSYVEVSVNAVKVIESWRESLFSFEWLLPDGRVKNLSELPYKEQGKRERVEITLKSGKMIEKPVLGIGILENIEIGIGKAEFLTLFVHGEKDILVHIPKSHESDFQKFLSDVNSDDEHSK